MTELYSFYQTAPNNGWAGPELLDASGGIQLSVAVNGEWQTVVAFIDESSIVNLVTQTASGASAGFGATQSLSLYATLIALATNADGTLELFYVDDYSNLYYARETGVATGAFNPGVAIGTQQAKQIMVAQNQDGRLELVYIGLDDYLYHAFESAPGADDWSTANLGFQARAVAFFLDTNTGCLQLFYTALSHEIFRLYQSAPNNGAWVNEAVGDYAKSLSGVVNSDGRLEIFYINDSDALYHNWQTAPGAGQWAGPAALPGSDGGPVFGDQVSVCQDEDGRLEVFYILRDGYLYHSWQTSVNGPWTSADGTTAVVNVQAYNIATIQYFGSVILLFCIGYRQPPAGDVPPPFYGGLAGSSNYWMANNGLYLDNPAVQIYVAQEISYSADGPPGVDGNGNPFPAASGFSIQMNCLSPSNARVALQQYVFGFNGNNIYGEVNNYYGNALGGGQSANHVVNFAAVAGGIPANYTLAITLNTDADANVIGVVFSVNDNTGAVQTSLVAIRLISAGGQSDVAPILCFQVVLVGPGSSESVTLSSGAGTIIYLGKFPFTPLQQPPVRAALRTTAESGNSVYGALQADPSNLLAQSFGIS